MRKTIALFAAAMLTACGLETMALVGEFRFVHIRNADSLRTALSPPAFDTFIFGNDGYATLRNTLHGYDVRARFIPHGKTIDMALPGGSDYDFRFRIDRVGLVLQSIDRRIVSPVEYVYVPVFRLVAVDEVVGEWFTDETDLRRRVFNADGTATYASPDGTSSGYYRVWKDKDGSLMVTTVLDLGEHRVSMFVERLTVEGPNATLSMEVDEALREQSYPTWHRVKAPNAG